MLAPAPKLWGASPACGCCQAFTSAFKIKGCGVLGRRIRSVPKPCHIRRFRSIPGAPQPLRLVLRAGARDRSSHAADLPDAMRAVVLRAGERARAKRDTPGHLEPQNCPTALLIYHTHLYEPKPDTSAQIRHDLAKIRGYIALNRARDPAPMLPLLSPGGSWAALRAAAPALPHALQLVSGRLNASWAGAFAAGPHQGVQQESQTQSEKAAVSAFVQEVRRVPALSAPANASRRPPPPRVF